MSEQQDKSVIFEALGRFARTYRAHLYCVLLCPLEDTGEQGVIRGNRRVYQRSLGEMGEIIAGVVEREVLLKPPKIK